MMDDFAPLEQALADLASRIEPGQARRAAGAIGGELRTANARRIRANVTPDGSPMPPRKARDVSPLRDRPMRATPAKPRSRRAERMFKRTAAQLRVRAADGEIRVGFTGAAARILGVHHHGLRDRVSREPGSPEVTYPAREQIGFAEADRLRVLERVAAFVAP